MKLTEKKLKQLINEVLSEGIGDNFYGMYGNKTQSSKPKQTPEPETVEMALPPEPEIPPVFNSAQAETIKNMLGSGKEFEINQAISFIDALARGSSFAIDYLEYIEARKTKDMVDDYLSEFDPDERTSLKGQIEDLVNRRAARLYPDDNDAAFNWAFDQIKNAGILEEALVTENKVPQEAKDKLFARMKRMRQVPTGATIEDAEFWEVKEGDYGFRDPRTGKINAIKVNGKYYYGEI